MWKKVRSLHFKTLGIRVVYQRYATPMSNSPMFATDLVALIPESPYIRPTRIAVAMFIISFKWDTVFIKNKHFTLQYTTPFLLLIYPVAIVVNVTPTD